MNFLLELLASKVRWCWNKKVEWSRGTLQWDCVTYRYVHLGHLCVSLDAEPDPAFFTINLYLPKRVVNWLARRLA